MCMQRLEEVNHDVPLIQGLPINHPKPNLLNGTIPPAAIEDNTQDILSYKYELSDILIRYGADYIKKHNVSVDELKVMNAIRECRTFAFGYHIDVCDSCGYIEALGNSCRNRHCPKCQGDKSKEWVEARVDQLLPAPYYHIVFTLPSKINSVCLSNKKEIYDLLFKSAAETLKEFGQDLKWVGGEIGFYGILHSWGQTLIHHPHIHFIVCGLGLRGKSEWIYPKYKGNFLFPVHGISKVFRGKFIEGLKQAKAEGELTLGDKLEEEKEFNKWVNRLVSKKWVVYCKKPFSGAEEVIKYVSRYTHRVAISNSRIISIEDGKVRFSYKNYKKQVKEYNEYWEEMELEAEEFISRFLKHVLPGGYHRIRYYGYLANGKKEKVQEALKYISIEATEPKEDIIPNKEGMKCPKCKEGIMEPVLVISSSGYIIKYKTGTFNQRNIKQIDINNSS